MQSVSRTAYRGFGLQKRYWRPLTTLLTLALLFVWSPAPAYAQAGSSTIHVCSHKATSQYNILGSNAETLRQKLTNPANFGPAGEYGNYDFKFVDVGDNFTEQKLLDEKCDIWFSGFEPDASYTGSELSELQKWVKDHNGQVMAGCDASANDPVCDLLGYAVVNDTDSYGYISDVANNPLNCNGRLTQGSKLNMSGGAGAYFSGKSTDAEILAVHETGGDADAAKPIVIYTGNYFLTSDINMIQTGDPDDGTLSDGAGAVNNNDILTMNAFSALADAAIGKEVCVTAKEIAKTRPRPDPAPRTGPVVPNSHGDVHISTPDGLVFDLQAAGEFYLAWSGGDDVVVQTRQEMFEKNPKVSVNTAVALMVGGDKLEFYVKPERAFYLNDERTRLSKLPLTLPGGGTITSTGNSGRPDFTIMWPDGSFGARVIRHGDSHLDVGVQSFKEGIRNYGGILGNLDGDARNDLKVRFGDQLTPPADIDDLNRFGDSWRVPAGASLFRGGTTAPVKPESQITLQDLDAEKRARAKQTCEQAGVTDRLALGNCTYDVAQTGDKAFVESAKVFEQAMKAAPPQTKIPGDAAAKAVIAGSIFPISERFELEQGAKYFSESGLHYLSLQDDGNLVVKTAEGRYVWGIQNSGKDYRRNKRAVMQEDGNLVTYDGDTPIWATDTYGKAGATLHLTPAGELHIIYRGKTIWNSAETEYK